MIMIEVYDKMPGIFTESKLHTPDKLNEECQIFQSMKFASKMANLQLFINKY